MTDDRRDIPHQFPHEPRSLSLSLVMHTKGYLRTTSNHLQSIVSELLVRLEISLPQRIDMGRNSLKVLGNLEIAQHTHILPLAFDLSSPQIDTPTIMLYT